MTPSASSRMAPTYTSLRGRAGRERWQAGPEPGVYTIEGTRWQRLRRPPPAGGSAGRGWPSTAVAPAWPAPIDGDARRQSEGALVCRAVVIRGIKCVPAGGEKLDCLGYGQADT
jgi:hypothetical protein